MNGCTERGIAVSKEDGWLAVHVYRDPLDQEFLVEGVGGVLRALAHTGHLKNFFFIRFAEGGVHVRLRVRGPMWWRESVATEVITRYFEDYFRRRPSPPDHRAVGTTRILDRMVVALYEPEVDRYGGPSRIGIAERQFELSSRVALRLISRSTDWQADNALGWAARLHVALVHAFGLTPASASALFARMSRAWARSVLGHVDPSRLPSARARLRDLFDSAFEEQRSRLIAGIGTLWRELEESPGRVHPTLLGHWYRGNEVVVRMLKRDSGRGATDLPRRRMLEIVESLLHMTSNRLGIGNPDESLLAYLLHRTMTEALPSQRRIETAGRAAVVPAR